MKRVLLTECKMYSGGFLHARLYVSIICQSVTECIYRHLITLSIVFQWKIHNSFRAPLFVNTITV